MSYARFGCDGSDVYVYASTNGIVCFDCKLLYADVTKPDARGMIEHLEKHRAAGHTVPDAAFERLREEASGAT